MAHTVLRAVNIETARVADQVSGELQGRMRLQWWKEAVETATRERAGPGALPPAYRTPVVLALAALAKHSPALDPARLQTLIDARMDALDPTQPQEIYALEKYAEETQSSLLYLLLQAAGYSSPIDADAMVCRAASHIGNALGLTVLLQAAPHHAAARDCPLPATIMAHHRVPTEDFYRAAVSATACANISQAPPATEPDSPAQLGTEEGEEATYNASGLVEVFYDVAGNAAVPSLPADPQRRSEPADGSRAQVHLEHARGLRSDVPKEFAPLLLPALLAEDYLNRLQACDFDGFHPALLHENGLASSPFPFQRRLAKHWLFGTY